MSAKGTGSRSRSPRGALLTLALLAAPAAADLTFVSVPAARIPAAAASLSHGLPSILFEAGEAARRTGFASARELLDPLASAGGSNAARARLELGFLAQGSGETELCESALSNADADPLLDDWRLAAWADCATARGHGEIARAALAALVSVHPDSPIRGEALARLAELDESKRAFDTALAFVDEARRSGVAGDAALRLERLAYRIGRSRGDRATTGEAARRLLVGYPLEAAKLGVAESLRSQNGELDWYLVLSRDELSRRANALLDAQVPEGAVATLSTVPAGERTLDEHLLVARALVLLHRGADALAELAALAPQDGAARSRLAWARAEAGLEAASPRRGRTNPGSDQRNGWRTAARADLLVVANSEADPVLAREAARRLFTDAWSEDRFEEAISWAKRLAALEPRETIAARPLWERGWREFDRKNFSGAIGNWSELYGLYPRASYGRMARYWCGRAYESLADRDRAVGVYREIASGAVGDFYTRQAISRLSGLGIAAAAPAIAPEPEPWPEDVAVARARLLSDLGLDGLAARELELVASRANPRAATALRALILARRGDRRASLVELHRAFPALATAEQDRAPREALALFYPLDFVDSVRRIASAASIPAPLVLGMIHQESAFDPRAKSRSGARGLLQLMPSTGREVARNLRLPWNTTKLWEPDYSLRLGAAYLRSLLDLFHGNVELALAAYDSGPGRIERLWNRHGPGGELDRFVEGLSPEETRNYVKRILLLADSYRSLYPELG